jgi:CheY-like chemotaxis protein
LLDIDLPDISGIEIAKIIRNLESSTGERSIMIAITGGGEGKRAGCIAAGMDDFISKPFKITLLEQVLDKHNYIRKVNQKSEQDSY